MKMDEYLVYKCLDCHKQFIVLRVEKEKHTLLSCPYCRNVQLKKCGTYDDIKECMKRKPRME